LWAFWSYNCTEEKAWEMPMKYKVNIKGTSEGYAICVPGLPGCWSQGKTEREALKNIKDAIQAYLETVEELSKDKESRYVEVG
jgi:predicted RNase H-like HicB family nuclease